MELEKKKAESFAAFKSEFLPTNCSSWLKLTSASSADFVKVYNEDFRSKLAKELVDLQQEQRDSLACLREARDKLKEPSGTILKNLNILLSLFTNNSKTPHSCTDPWINELAVRRNAALFLEQKANYLNILYRIYSQVKHLHFELSRKLADLSEEYFRILERFGMSTTIENMNNVNPFGSNIVTWDDLILKQYSLDYDWKLECPPLDGLLFTLFSNLKSLGAALSLQITKSSSIPRIFSEQFLRIGFLQKSVSGIISRSWQVFFVILQPSTRYLHFYKTSSSSSSSINSTNLLVPSIGTSYTKASLQDLNLLATQFFLQNPHQPASLSPQILTPSMSFSLSKESKAAAGDPGTFTFVLRANSNEKITLRAFCEEEFVDWVISLNEVIKSCGAESKHENEELKNRNDSKDSLSSPSISGTIADISEPQQQESESSHSPSYSQPSAPIVDLENPWS